MRDMKNNIKDLVALAPVAITSNTTTVGLIIDLQGFNSATMQFMTGVLTDGDYVFLLQEGDDASLSDASAVADADLIGTEADMSFTDDTDDAQTAILGYIGTKRYIRASIISTGTTTGALVSVACLLGNASICPVA